MGGASPADHREVFGIHLRRTGWDWKVGRDSDMGCAKTPLLYGTPLDRDMTAISQPRSSADISEG